MNEKNKFLKGALCGALAVFLLMSIAGAAIFGLTRLGTSETKVVNSDVQEKLEKIEGIIDDSYLYESDIDKEELTEGMFAGYVEALGDPYSVYYDAQETAELVESTQGEYSGIGAVLSQDQETMIITIVNVYKDSPAEEAKIKDGDIIYKVNDEEISGLTVSEVVTMIKGEENTEVTLTLLRGEDAKEVTVTAKRRKIEVETVTWEMKEDKIGYIRVSEFDGVTYEQYKEALEELEAAGMEGLVVDLRSNPGGNLTTVCEMADLMLPEGTIVYTEDKQGKKNVASSDEENQFTKPLVVLVNQYSASASEIYAGAIQDYELGDIVGVTTYGKGVVQQIFELGDDTCLKLTISEYFTPNGRNINGTGIEPDVEVEYEPNEENPEADNQLERGMEVLKEKIK